MILAEKCLPGTALRHLQVYTVLGRLSLAVFICQIANLLLEAINNIDEECSEDNQEISDIENDNAENHYDLFSNDSNIDENEENVSNIRRGRKRRRFLVSSDSENEEQVLETAIDGTVWQEVKEGSNPGRAPIHNIFRETSGPTGYSKRNIMKGQVKTAFSLIIDKNIIGHIRKCTETEAFRVLGSKWGLSTAKLHAFFALLYARGARQEFVFQLAEELATDYQKDLQLEEDQATIVTNISTGSRRRKTCQIRYCNDNKTNKICLKCKRYVCGKCTLEKPICEKCLENE